MQIAILTKGSRTNSKCPYTSVWICNLHFWKWYKQLERAISEAISNREIRDRASKLGEQIRSENGVARTVEIVRETIQLRQG